MSTSASCTSCLSEVNDDFLESAALNEEVNATSAAEAGTIEVRDDEIIVADLVLRAGATGGPEANRTAFGTGSVGLRPMDG